MPPAWRRMFSRSTGAVRMDAPQPAARFGIDIPAELTEAMTGGGTIAPRISRAQALQVPAVLRARNLICGSLGTLPVRVHGPDKRVVENVQYLVPATDPDIPQSVVMAQTVEDLLFEGVAWWRVTAFGWHGYPVQARHVPVGSVHVAQVGTLMPSQMRISEDQPFPVDGQVYIDGVPVPDNEVIRFDSPNPPLLKAAARAIRAALQLDQAAALYAKEPLPLGYFAPREGVDPADNDDIQKVLDDWEAARSKRAWGYVNAALEAKTLQWNPEQLQLAQQRQHAVLEIARATGIDPEDLGVSTTSRTYQNGVQRRLDLIDFTLGPYVSAIQDRLSMRDVLPRAYVARIDFGGFLRGDAKTRMETYKVGLEVGVYADADEVRVEEGKPLLTPSQRSARRPAPQPTDVQEEPEMADDVPAAAFARDLPDHWAFAVDSPPWGSLSDADYTPEQWRRASLIDTDVGDVDSKERHKLPVKTPSGAVHRGGVRAAAAALAGARGGVKASAEQKARAARALVRMYREMDEEPPESMMRMAGMMSAEADKHPQLSFDDPEACATFYANEDKRTISGMVVPWGKVAVSRGSRWRFRENSLRWRDASRIKLNLGHDRYQSVGYAAGIRNTSKGLEVTFKIADVPEGDRALKLAAGKAWDGLSIEIDFEDEFGDDWRPDPTDNTVRLVQQAKLTHVALTPTPAFDDARVAAVAASTTDAMTEGGADGPGGEKGRARGRGPRVRVRSRRLHQATR